MKLFQYYEIRAAVDFGDYVKSYLGPAQWDPALGAHVCTADGALKEAEAHGRPVFWTIYGVDQEGMSTAIGDYVTYDTALEILHAILVPFRRAIDGTRAVSDIEDILNQSSNEDRL